MFEKMISNEDIEKLKAFVLCFLDGMSWDEIPIRIDNDTNILKKMKDFAFGGSGDEEKVQMFANAFPSLKDNMVSDIVDAFSSSTNDTSCENSSNKFYDEFQLLKSLKNDGDKNVLEDIDNIKESYQSFGDEEDSGVDFDKYKEQYENLMEKSQDEWLEKLKELNKKFFEELMDNFSKRYLDYLIKELEKRREKFIEDFYSKIGNYRSLANKIEPLLDSGFFWDLSTGKFDDYGFRLVEEFLKKFENSKKLQELVDLLGRAKEESKILELEKLKKEKDDTDYIKSNAYKGEIDGVTQKSDITSLLASELVLFKNAKTKTYFNQKFVEDKLLSYSYKNLMNLSKTKEKETEELCYKKGPIIICIDTSRSMVGAPEAVCKTLALAISKRALKEKRGCFLISFSTQIKVLDLSYNAKGKGIADCLEFLAYSFNGGTDATPALVKSLELLKQNDWKNSDVLMISDFCTGDLGSELTESIKEQQAVKTKFYSLLINSGSGNRNIIKVFDENWQYNTNSNDSMNLIMKNIKEKL